MGQSTADDPASISKSFKVFAVIIAAVIGAAAIWGADKRSLGLFHDDGVYVVVAKALAENAGYRISSLPGEPAQTKYPFFYSYLLSWLWSLQPEFPENVLLLKSLNIIVLIGIYFASLRLYRCVSPHGRVGAVGFAVLVCINPLVFTFTDYAVSDLLFVLLALGALVVSHRNTFFPSTVLSLAVIAGLACLNRLAAASLALAGLLDAFRRWGLKGGAVFAGTTGIIIAPWLYWVWSQPKPSFSLLSYYSAYDFASEQIGMAEKLARHSEIIYANALYILSAVNLLYLLPLLPVLIPLVSGLTLLGMAASRSSSDLFSWWFLIFSLALLLIWPFQPARYMAPLAPVLVLFLFRGMAAAEHWLKKRGGDYAAKPLVVKLPWVTVVFLLVLQGVWISSYLLIRDPNTTRGGFGSRMAYSWSGFEESFAWIRDNTRPETKLATAYDPMYFLYTGRQAIRPALHRPATYFYPYGAAKPDVGSVAEVKAVLDSMGIEYLIIDPMQGYAEGGATTRLLEELIVAYGNDARPVFTSTDGKHRVYALRTAKG